jgi:tRNA threonylcarbamoyl adenosine modification protein YeaZ
VSSVVCERCWHNEALRNQAIFTVIPELLSEADWQMEDVELFAIDLGPGSFAGVRTALAASEGFAMVDRKPIVGVGSGEAIAADLFEEGHEGPIAVVGDARRHRFWVAVFEQGKKSPHPALPYTLTTAVELKETLKRVKTVATPEWDRIGELLSRMVGPSTELIKEPRVPSAATVGYLAMAAYLPATIAPLPQPIYLHPAVFVKPKYGKTAES